MNSKPIHFVFALSLLALCAGAAGCRGTPPAPRAGDACSSLADNICDGPRGPGILVCDTSAREYYHHTCSTVSCIEAGFTSWTGRCETASSGNQACICNP